MTTNQEKFQQRLKTLLAPLTAGKVVGAGGLAVLCAAALLAFVPGGQAGGAVALATLLSNVGVNVLSGLLQKLYEEIWALPGKSEPERLAALALALEQRLPHDPALQREAGAFLAATDTLTLATAVAEGNPASHAWLLTALREDVARYNLEFAQLHRDHAALFSGMRHIFAAVFDTHQEVLATKALVEQLHDKLNQISQPASMETVPKHRVQIYLEGDFSALSDERKLAAIDAFAAILNITPHAINVFRVFEGSIVFDLGIPPDAFQHLHSLLQSNNAQLRLLGVKRVVLKNKAGDIEEWFIREGTFNLKLNTAQAPVQQNSSINVIDTFPRNQAKYVINAAGGQFGVVGDNAYVGEIHFHSQSLFQPVDEETLQAALTRLAELPLDTIPAPAPLTPASRLPYACNPHFVGREADLKWLARTLTGAGATAAIGQIAAATGLGGIGKTQLAAEFAHR
jgi:hypothetical protein